MIIIYYHYTASKYNISLKISNISMGENLAYGIELTTISVKGYGNDVTDTWWEYNVSEQFPIKSVNETNGPVTIEVDKPHEGCIIRTSLKNSKMEGESYIYSNDNVLMAKLTFVDGVATGPCTIYNNGYLFYSGYFENGYREGRGKEYDKNGKLVSDGYYSKGKKLNIVPSKEMGKGYWKEYDENGELIRICQKDDLGNYDGYCYFFNSGKISRVSVWKEGKETELLKQFKDNIMVEYKNGKKVYEGGFLDSMELDYPRNGEGVEYGKDEKTRSFQGNYTYDKRHGKGSKIQNGLARKEIDWIMGYKSSVFWCINAVIFFIVLLMIIGLFVDVELAIILWIFVMISLLIGWIHYNKTHK